MAEYLSQRELIQQIETNLNRIESGTLNLSEIEGHLTLVRELYERTIALRYKAFEQHSSFETRSIKEEFTPIIEGQEFHEDVNTVDIQPEKNDNQKELSEEDRSEIEFDFFVEQEEKRESSQEETIELNQQNIESLTYEAPEPLVEKKSSDFVLRVFEVEKEIRSQIGFSSIPTLADSFGLNERLLYINELFDGSSESFSDAVKQIDSRSGLADAAVFLEETAKKFNWDIESETVEEFIQKLCRRYA